MTESNFCRVSFNDPICPGCGNTADDGVNVDTGLCDYCMDTPKNTKIRRLREAQDDFESGHPMSDDDR